MIGFSRKVGFEAILRDGARAWIRPVEADDKGRIACGMRQLSNQSRYLRFFNSAPDLDPILLKYLTEVDQRNHVAWIAVNDLLPGEPGLGIARFIRLQDNPSVAEMALTVVDDYQGLGLGAALLNILLVRAEQLGIDTLRAIVLPDNYRVLRWMRRLGATTRYQDGLIELNLAVEGNRCSELEPSTAAVDHRSYWNGRGMRRAHLASKADALALAADG